MTRTYRIKPEASPYGGRRLLVRAEHEQPDHVSGMVDLGRRAAPGLRRYDRDEIEEIGTVAP